MWQPSPLALWSRVWKPPASGGSVKSHLHCQGSFPAPSLGVCSGSSHRNCLTTLGFQYCNHFCQFWKGVEDSVKHLSGLFLWRFCTILSSVGFSPYFTKGSELSFQSPESPEFCQTCCPCCWQALLPSHSNILPASNIPGEMMPQTPPAEDFSSSAPKTCSPTSPSLDFCTPL